MKKTGYTHVVHTFGPVYDRDSRILILGSVPSVKSREKGFYYGHPQNRFWKVMSALLKEEMPDDNEGKREVLLRHGIALYDTVYSCDISGSSDSTIRNVVPSDLSRIIEESGIERLFCNGKTSGALFQRYQRDSLKMEAVVLPSTSPANAAWTLDMLIDAWSIIKE
ncbi:MAG: DNA-deoxyinosine glycosylase [Oscillospiraceae bacterium]|nr:DNA-deoxyinosine glycosylase [Oscillospiraceae bacterium]